MYDPFLGSLLAPDWRGAQQQLLQPELLLLYRVNGNDPVNLPARRSQTGGTHLQHKTECKTNFIVLQTSATKQL